MKNAQKIELLLSRSASSPEEAKEASADDSSAANIDTTDAFVKVYFGNE